MKKWIVLILIIFAIAFAIGCGREKEEKATPEEGQVKVLYQCSMHPDEISEEPGDCYSMPGMKLVPVKMVYRGGKWVPAQEETSSPAKKMEMEHKEMTSMLPPGQAPVHIDARKQQLIGVKTAIVKKERPEITLRTVGFVDYNERRIYVIDLKFSGWIEKLFVNYTGKKIRKGEPLFEIYSPEVLRAQEEFLVSLSSRDEKLKENVIRKFQLWEIPHVIKSLRSTGKALPRITVYSPYTGFVIEKKALEGLFVKPGMELYKIADLSKVWIYGEIFEFELPFVFVGQKVTVESPYLPGKQFEGKVSYIYPEVELKTRTVRLRVEVPNPEYELKPGMYVNLKLKYSFARETVVVPEEAVLLSGETAYVFLDKGNGYFEPRLVKLGPKAGEVYVVLEGLKGGERVVTSANFLIDSESKLKAAISGMSGHQH